MKTKLFDNLLLKILSVIAAVFLWLIVVNIDDAVDNRQIRNVKVNMVNMEVLTSQGQMCRVEDGTDTVDLTVYARRSVLNRLKASDFVVTADVQKDLQFGSMVKIEVAYVGDSSIERVEQNRENVLVSIEESVTEQFKVAVKLQGEPEKGLVPGSVIPEQTLVEITGPRSAVERIKVVQVEVPITGITGTVVRPGRLKLLDSDGNEINGTYLDYYGKDTDFNVTVTTLNTKEVGISFDISQAAPEGYGLSAITYKPETVKIAGTSAQIRPIYNLNIPPEALNPEGATGRVEQTVDISRYLEEGLVIPDEGEREIVVTMDITQHAAQSYLFTPDRIQYQNVPEGMEPDLSEAGVLEISVSGLEEDLAGVTAESITASVDLSECRRPGTYTLPVNVTVPEGLRAPEGLELTVELVRSSQRDQER